MKFYKINVVLCFFAVQCFAISLINVDDCGKTKGCFFNPGNCNPSKNCSVAVTYSVENEEVVFEFSAPIRIQVDPSQGQYIALGFSYDREMGDDAVTYCIFSKDDATKTAAGVSYNKKDEKLDEPINDTPTRGIVTLTESGMVNSTFICRLKQKIQPNFKDTRVRALNNPYYLLMVTGTADLSTNSLTVHTTDHNSRWFPAISKDQVNLLTKSLISPAPHEHD